MILDVSKKQFYFETSKIIKFEYNDILRHLRSFKSGIYPGCKDVTWLASFLSSMGIQRLFIFASPCRMIFSHKTFSTSLANVLQKKIFISYVGHLCQPHTKFFSTQKRVNRNKTDTATKQLKLHKTDFATKQR